MAPLNMTEVNELDDKKKNGVVSERQAHLNERGYKQYRTN